MYEDYPHHDEKSLSHFGILYEYTRGFQRFWRKLIRSMLPGCNNCLKTYIQTLMLATTFLFYSLLTLIECFSILMHCVSKLDSTHVSYLTIAVYRGKLSVSPGGFGCSPLCFVEILLIAAPIIIGWCLVFGPCLQWSHRLASLVMPRRTFLSQLHSHDIFL